MVDPNEFVSPRNGYAMSFRDFVSHLLSVMQQLGLSLRAATEFIQYALLAFPDHPR